MKKLSKIQYRIALVLYILAILLTAGLTILVGYTAQQRRAAAAAQRAAEREVLTAQVDKHLQELDDLQELLELIQSNIGPKGHKPTEKEFQLMHGVIQPLVAELREKMGLPPKSLKVLQEPSLQDFALLRAVVTSMAQQTGDQSRKLGQNIKSLPVPKVSEVEEYEQLQQLVEKVTSRWKRVNPLIYPVRERLQELEKMAKPEKQAPDKPKSEQRFG